MDHPLLDGLNPPQRRAVCHVDGPALVIAGAGSGKTRVLTRRIAWLLASDSARPRDILAVTFTNKAAAEMRERVAGLVGRDAASELTVSTFHSFCVRVLRVHMDALGYRRDFTVSTEGDVRAMVRRVLDDLAGSSREGLSPAIVLDAIGAAKNAGDVEAAPAIPVADGAAAEKYRKWFSEVYDRYESALRAANAVDFDDLLLLTLRLWRKRPEVLRQFQQRFRQVLVDEFQDTNRVQFALLELLCAEHRNLFVVGDDDQSIYSWRGAEPRNILEFDRAFPGAAVIKLEQNYRSTTTILDAANHVIARNLHRRQKKLWSALGSGRPIDWLVTGDDEHEARMAASWLEAIRSRTGADYTDFAVLYRSNQQSRAFEMTFRSVGIPYVVFGGQDFYERPEVRDVVSYLRVLANPRDEAALLRIINVPRRGIGDTTLQRVHARCGPGGVPFVKALHQALDEGILPREAQSGLHQLLGVLDAHRERLRAGEPLPQVAEAFIADTGYRDYLRETARNPEQAEVRGNNIDLVLRAVADYCKENAAPSLAGFLDDSALAADTQRSGDPNKGRKGVHLMTVHSAKGLEFPFVFIAGIEEGRMPHARSVGEAAIEEERRLFYVALTRAQRHITLFEALERERNGRAFPTKTSRFALEIPEQFISKRALADAGAVEKKYAPKKRNGAAGRPARKPRTA